MDDELKFGPVLHRLTFAEAVDQDLLCDYQVVVVGVSDSSYREMAQRAAFVSADGRYPRRITVAERRALTRAIAVLKPATLPPFKGTCPIAYDGQERHYRFHGKRVLHCARTTSATSGPCSSPIGC